LTSPETATGLGTSKGNVSTPANSRNINTRREKTFFSWGTRTGKSKRAFLLKRKGGGGGRETNLHLQTVYREYGKNHPGAKRKTACVARDQQKGQGEGWKLIPKTTESTTIRGGGERENLQTNTSYRCEFLKQQHGWGKKKRGRKEPGPHGTDVGCK